MVTVETLLRNKMLCVYINFCRIPFSSQSFAKLAPTKMGVLVPLRDVLFPFLRRHFVLLDLAHVLPYTMDPATGAAAMNSGLKETLSKKLSYVQFLHWLFLLCCLVLKHNNFTTLDSPMFVVIFLNCFLLSHFPDGDQPHVMFLNDVMTRNQRYCISSPF